MSETETAVPPSSPAAPEAPAPDVAPTPPPSPPRRRGAGWVVLAALLFLVLFGAVGYVWQRQQELIAAYARQPAVSAGQLAALEHRLGALEQQIAAVQARPAPAPAPPPAPAVDLGPLEAHVAALEQRIAAVQQRPAAAPADLGPLEQRLASVAAAAQAAEGAQARMSGQLSDLEQRLGTAEQQARQLGAKAAQAQRLSRALVALDAGDKLGDIPGAPPALARFADEKPPTEAALRLSFPQAAEAAVKASRPSTAGKSFGERMWLRARSLVTVREGDKVLVGAPAAEVLGRAQARLDAGDLAGAVAVLDGLDGPAAAAMTPWRKQAQALLDARAALAQMARG